MLDWATGLLALPASDPTAHVHHAGMLNPCEQQPQQRFLAQQRSTPVARSVWVLAGPVLK